MLAVEVTATTEDAAPATPPYRISNDPGFDDFLLEWGIEGDGPVHYWQVRMGGINPISGHTALSQGIICNMGQRCDEPGSVALELSTPVDDSHGFVAADLPATDDGDYLVELDARDGDGWDT